MSVRIFATAAALAEGAAETIRAALADAIAARGRATIALSGGATPRATYEALAALPLDWSKIEIFFGDERGVPAEHPESNFRLVRAELLDRLRVAPAAVHRMPADAPDRAAAARAYAALLPDALDVLLLGVGADGHTASLFPGSPALGAAARVVPAEGPPPQPQRMTVTPPVIAAARHVIVIVSGADKADAVARALEGPEDPGATPAQLVRGGAWLIEASAAKAGLRTAQDAISPPYLVGDVGGTKALLALASRDTTGRLVLSHVVRYESADWEGLEPIVVDFLARVGIAPQRAAFGLAGPVVEDRWSAPNLTWTLHRPTIEERLGMRVLLMNDFEAAGWGIAELGPADLVALHEGSPVPHGPRVLMGAGTGLGQAVLLWQGNRYVPFPTEGGHGDYAARTEREWRLRQFVSQRVGGRVSVERVVSGPGIRLIYEFLRDEGAAPESPEVAAEMTGPDPAAVVSRRALAGDDRLCVEAIDQFVTSFGAEAGNFALRAVATGGVFIGGGVAPRILERLVDGNFLRAFLDRGRMRDLVERIPVSVIVNPNVALLGTAARAAHA